MSFPNFNKILFNCFVIKAFGFKKSFDKLMISCCSNFLEMLTFRRDMKNILTLIAVMLTLDFLSGQESKVENLSAAQELIETLTSDAFSGRGYHENGMDKAADFLKDEFEKLNLEKINGTYFQEFSMPINVIKDAKLTLNNKVLRYGIDFLVKPNSKTQYFHLKPIYNFSPTDFENALISEENLIKFIENDMTAQHGKHVVFPPHHFEIDSLNRYYKNWFSFYRPEENRNRSIFYFTKDKLTASLSMRQDSIAAFVIKDEFYDENLEINDYMIESEFITDFKARNILGKIEGRNKDSLIVITSHYDHLGKVGSTIFPGASDNASGVAFVLNLAAYFSKNQPKYSLAFMLFAAEEAGLVGSRYFVENPLFDLNKIKFLLNFDIMGAGENGIQIVNSSIYPQTYDLLQKINQEKQLTPQIKKRGEACNSDHCPFYEIGIPSFFTYTLGGPGFYHDPMDKAETLNLFGFSALQELFIEWIEKLE